jgi:hypothetical protein
MGDNTEMDLKEIEWKAVYSIDPTLDRDKYREAVNTESNSIK